MKSTAPDLPNWPPGPRRLRLRHLFTWVLDPERLLDEMERRGGSTFTVPSFFGRPPMVWLGEPEAIREVFAGDPELFLAGKANFILEGVLGSQSLLLLDGEAHRRERRLMMPPFHGERMRAYGRTMREVAARAIAGWPVGKPFALLPEMHAITLDVILRTVFGLDEGPRMTELRAALTELLARTVHPLLFGASLVVHPRRVRSFLIHGLERSERVLGRFDLSPLVPGSRVAKVMRRVEELLTAEFARRREAARSDAGAGRPPREDILALLLAARDESGQPLDDQHLRDEMLTLLLAGHETTGTALAWAMRHLLANPDVLARLQAELLPLAPGGLDGFLDPDALARNDYLDAVCKETLRLVPVVPLVARQLARDARVGSHHLPAGMMVVPAVYLVHHRPDLYPEPTRFRPERFLERSYGPHEFLPFGGGLRRCLGAAFATYEMKIVLAELVTQARFRAVGETAGIARRGILFGPRGGTRVVMERASALV